MQVVFVSPKPPTEEEGGGGGEVFLFHVYFRKLLGGVSSRCITPSQIALQRRALFIFSWLENAAHDLAGVFIELPRCLRYFRDAGLLGQI